MRVAIAGRKLGALIALGLLAAIGRMPPASAQGLPAARLWSVFPPGGQVGTSFDVTISGADLEDAGQLLFSVGGITAVQKTTPPGLGQNGPQPVANKFKVTIAPDAAAGICEVRVAGKYGVSNPCALVIGRQRETAEREPNNNPQQAMNVSLATTINGRSNDRGDQDYYKFTAHAGQRVIIDCWAWRIDSRIDASLVLFDEQGKELARNRDARRRDPLLDFTVPADGEYLVLINDFLYAGSGDYYYRLQIGVETVLDFVFPPAGLAGTSETYTLYGRNLPGGKSAEQTAADGALLEKLDVSIALPADASDTRTAGAIVEPSEAGIDAVTYRLPTVEGPAGEVLVGLATAPVVREQEPNDEPDAAQMVAAPCEVVGQFYPNGDRDWVTFEARKGEPLWIEVLSQRLGLPTDPHLIVQQIVTAPDGTEQVKDLQAVDDFLDNPRGASFEMRTLDPALRFNPPADGRYRILIRNQDQGPRDDPRLVWRLVIRPPAPDFRLVAQPRLAPFSGDANQNPPVVWSSIVRAGAAELLDVFVFRQDGFDGEVALAIEGAPAGVSAAEVTVGSAQSNGVLVLESQPSVEASPPVPMRVIGRATIGGRAVEHTARSAGVVWGGATNQVAARMRLVNDLPVVVSSEQAPFSVGCPQATVEMCRGGTVKLPVSVERRGDFKGDLAIFPTSLPSGARANGLSIAKDKNDGTLEFRLPPNAPIGTYSFAVIGASQQVPYVRNPEAVERIRQRKQALEAIVAERNEAVQAAGGAKSDAERQIDEAAAAVSAAHELIATLTRLTAADASAAGLLNTARESADSALAAANELARQSAERKDAAQTAINQAQAKVKEAAGAQQAVEKSLTDATNNLKPKNLRVGAPTPAITLRITAAPVMLPASLDDVHLSQGNSAELPIEITRLYDYTDAVQVRGKTPDGERGLKVVDATIAADQTTTRLKIEASAAATPGNHAVQLTATARLNGQDVTTTAVVHVKIE